MTWTPLLSQTNQGLEAFWALPKKEDGGSLWIRLPAVESPQSIQIGWGDANQTPPTRSHLKASRLEAFSQLFQFELPGDLDKPFLGIRFRQQNVSLNIFYQWIPMSVVIPVSQSDLPVVGAADFVSPIDAAYDRFVLEPTGETFTRYSDDLWKGEFFYSSDSFSPTVDSSPQSRISDILLSPAITFHPTERQSLLSKAEIQNLSNVTQTVWILASSDAGIHYNGSAEILGNGSVTIATDLKREDLDSLQVRVCCTQAIQLAFNTTCAELLGLGDYQAALVEIMLGMTGENTPAPFIARSSHPSKVLLAAWQAFDGNPATNLLTTFQDDGSPVRIETFVGVGAPIRQFSLDSALGGPTNRDPRLFEIQTSQDGVTWQTVAGFDETAQNWHGQTKTYSGLNIQGPWVGLLLIADYGANAPEVSAIKYFR